MRRSIIVLVAGCWILAMGCREEEFSRFPSVSVPQYAADDYLRELSNHNPEVVYNAVCNLGGSAQSFGRLLSDEKADRTSEEFRTAQAVYPKIVGLLQRPEPEVVAASLRFLELFAAEYQGKAGLVEPICRVKGVDPVVQFEQACALNAVVTNGTRVPALVLRQLVDSRSWIVSRSAYQLVDRLGDKAMRRELVWRYRATKNEKERLLLLTAFSTQPGPLEVGLIETEMLTTTNAKVRSAVRDILALNMASSTIRAWLGEHFKQFPPEDRTRLFEACAGQDSEEAADLVCRFLGQGYVPDDEFLQKLNKRMEQNPEKTPSYVLRVEQAVWAVPGASDRWRAMREKAVQARARFAALRGEYEPLAQEFAGKARALLTKYEVPAAEQQKFLEPVTSLKPEIFGSKP